MPIEIAEYDPSWASRFAQESARIAHALGAIAIRIDHVGSTSVPGLAAKDIIDIQVSVDRLELERTYRDPLERIDYIFRPDDETEHRFFKLESRSGKRLVHVHVCVSSGRWEERTLAFRDLLRAEPQTAAAYERLKRELAAKFENGDEYADAKGPFIAEAMTRWRPA